MTVLPTLKSFAAVLYDLDGVLINSGPAWFNVVKRARDHFSYKDAVTWQQFQATFGQGVEADRLEFFPRHSVEQVTQFYDSAFWDELSVVQIADGAFDLLAQVKQAGIKQAVVTNTPVALAAKILAEKKILPFLDTFAAAGEAPEKPAPDLVYLALNRLGVTAPQAIYLGDSPSDAAATKAAGVTMIGVHYTNTTHSITSLRELLPLAE